MPSESKLRIWVPLHGLGQVFLSEAHKQHASSYVALFAAAPIDQLYFNVKVGGRSFSLESKF